MVSIKLYSDLCLSDQSYIWTVLVLVGVKKGGGKICDPDFHLEEIFNVKESNKKMKELC